MSKVVLAGGWLAFSPELAPGQYWVLVEEQVFEGDDDGKGGFTQEHVGVRHHMAIAYLSETEIDAEFTGEVHAVQASDVSQVLWIPVDEIRAVKPFAVIEQPEIRA